MHGFPPHILVSEVILANRFVSIIQKYKKLGTNALQTRVASFVIDFEIKRCS
jgi:hypothetical protein